jgi:hypothetical protein
MRMDLICGGCVLRQARRSAVAGGRGEQVAGIISGRRCCARFGAEVGGGAVSWEAREGDWHWLGEGVRGERNRGAGSLGSGECGARGRFRARFEWGGVAVRRVSGNGHTPLRLSRSLQTPPPVKTGGGRAWRAGASGDGGSDEGCSSAAEVDVVAAGAEGGADGLGGEAAVGAELGIVVGGEKDLDVGLGEPEEEVGVVWGRHEGREARRHGGGRLRAPLTLPSPRRARERVAGGKVGGEGWKVLVGREIGGEECAVGGGEGWGGLGGGGDHGGSIRCLFGMSSTSQQPPMIV